MSDQVVSSVRSGSSSSGWQVAARVMSVGAALAVVGSESLPWGVTASDWSDSVVEYSRADVAMILTWVDTSPALGLFVQHGIFVALVLAAAVIVRSFSKGWPSRADQVLMAASAAVLAWGYLAVNDLNILLDDRGQANGEPGALGPTLLAIALHLTLGAVVSIWVDGRRSRQPKPLEFAAPNPTSRVG